jgi:hypothetical protein
MAGLDFIFRSSYVRGFTAIHRDIQMKLTFIVRGFAAILVLLCQTAFADSFPYSGLLTDIGKALEGSYDLRFTFYTDGKSKDFVSPPVIVNGVSVHRGRFAANVDLGKVTWGSS